MSTLLLLAGTKKGVFIGRADAASRGAGAWRFSGPHCSGTWSFCDVRYDEASGVIYGGGQSNWYGAAVWRSADLGETWTHSSEGLVYADGPGIEQVWCVRPVGDALYAGVDPAGLFKSVDGGRTWAEVESVRRHDTRGEWRGTNGGLPLSAILPPAHDGRLDGSVGRTVDEGKGIEERPDDALWVAISAGGVYRSADSGRTWERLPMAGDPCVHALVQAAGGALYQQNHAGVWRSDDGGTCWTDASSGLPSKFGFPLVAHPRAASTVYAVPLQSAMEGERHVSDERMAVWRTRDGGGSWHALTTGLPDGRTYLTVLRGALAVDGLEPTGVYAGTPTGQLFGSANEGDSWFEVTRGLPPIYSVSCAVV